MIESIDEIYKISSLDENISIVSLEETNKVIESREVLNLTVNVAGTGDMQKSIYDADDDGVVDFAKDLALTNEDWTQFNLILLS